MSPQVAADHGCHYLPDVLAVRPEDLGRTVEILADNGVGADDATDALYPSDDQSQGDGTPLVRLLLTSVDPHHAASVLAHQETPVEASPVHGVGYETHVRFMSGDGPNDVSGVSLTGADHASVDLVIAVVDSGIVDEELRPDWMSSATVESGPADIETLASGDASHGTFVTSILRRVAPDHTVSIAAAPPDTAGRLITRREAPMDASAPTSELDVLGAILRLITRHSEEPGRVRALNLSLGAARCGDNDGFLLTLKTAISAWRATMGTNIPVFAAGGNSPDPRPVYPAALPWVRAVAALDDNENQVVWHHAAEQVAAPRTWITDAAPGSRVEGLSGRDPDDVVSWSGSSFATAAVTGHHVAGTVPGLSNGIAVWPGV